MFLLDCEGNLMLTTCQLGLGTQEWMQRRQVYGSYSSLEMNNADLAQRWEF